MKRIILLLLLVIVLVTGFIVIFGDKDDMQEMSKAVQGDLPTEKKDVGNIRLMVKGFKNTLGVAHVFLYDVSDRDDVYSTPSVYIDGESTLSGEQIDYEFSDVPFGEYAIKVYHDENNNGRFDTGPQGEALGFSENIPAASGLKNIAKAKFSFHTSKIIVNVQLN